MQKFADDLTKAELFLGCFLVFGLFLAALGVVFAVVPYDTLVNAGLIPESPMGSSDVHWQWKLVAGLCGISTIVVIVPLFSVLNVTVTINEHLSTHIGLLRRDRYTTEEQLGLELSRIHEMDDAEKKDTHEVIEQMRASIAMMSHLIDMLKEDDQLVRESQSRRHMSHKKT